MRILFLNDAYPGRLGALAACFATNPENEVLFASSYARQGFSLPGVHRVLLKTARENGENSDKDAFEREWIRALKVGRLAASSLLKLRETGFSPDMIVSSSARGHALFVRQIFPQAFYVSYTAELFASPGIADYCYSDKALLQQVLQSAYLNQSHIFFVFSQWQKKIFPEFMRDCIDVVPTFVDTDFFCTELADPLFCNDVNLSSQQELISFSITNMQFARSKTLWQFIVRLLQSRPQCHVVLSTGRPEIKAQLEAFPPLLLKNDENRLHIMDFLSLREYRDMLCASLAHIRLDSQNNLGKLLEIMSCGTVLITPFQEDSDSVGVLHHNENMLFCPEGHTIETCHHLVEQLANPEALNALRVRARETALAFRQQDVLTRHAMRLTNEYARWKDGQNSNSQAVAPG